VRTNMTRDRILTPRENFWIGALSKATAATVTFPLTVAKVKQQMRKRQGSLGYNNICLNNNF
jgi:hypothetical protein